MYTVHYTVLARTPWAKKKIWQYSTFFRSKMAIGAIPVQVMAIFYGQIRAMKFFIDIDCYTVLIWSQTWLVVTIM